MIRTHIADRQKSMRLPQAAIRRLVRAVLRGEGHDDVTVSLAFVDDATIHRVNRRFLRHDRPTDVISFPMSGGPHPHGEEILGEIVISTEYARMEARRRKITPREELLRYVAHGILHLLGYDDKTPAEKRKMWNRQERYVRKV